MKLINTAEQKIPEWELLKIEEIWTCFNNDETEKCAIIKIWSETNRLIPRPVLELHLPVDVDFHVKKVIHPSYYMKRNYKEFDNVYFSRNFSPTAKERVGDYQYERNIILDNFTKKGQSRYYLIKGKLSKLEADIDFRLMFKVVK